jgi:hypothetical protein
MQGHNRSKSRGAKPGDGTQPGNKPESSDANWFGVYKEPQEEYIENDVNPNEILKVNQEQGPMSEGQPTMGSPGHHPSPEKDRFSEK